MPDDPRTHLEHHGFVVLRGALPLDQVLRINDRIESAIDSWAAELSATRQQYLDAACRWSAPNPLVEALATQCADVLAPLVEGVAGPGFSPSRASVFRKSASASMATHGHQDAGYWVRPTSRRYGLTTWVALDPVDDKRGALRVVPGSQRGGVGPPVDYLRRGFTDPAENWGHRAVTVDAEPGDVIVFGPKLWHASHPVRGGSIRRSLALRWVGPGMQVLSPQAPSANGHFGMYTSGEHLMRALCWLAGRELPWGLESVAWVLEHGLVDALPDATAARTALSRLRVYLRAAEAHHASDQRGMVWDAVRDDVVLPVLGPD